MVSNKREQLMGFLPLVEMTKKQYDKELIIEIATLQSVALAMTIQYKTKGLYSPFYISSNCNK
jgi:hypothetical protein